MSESNQLIFETTKPKLLSIAYKMLGSVSDAEDIVHDAYEKWLKHSQADVESPEAYLVTMVTRLCIDYLKSARKKRELYIGPWLPEPIIDMQVGSGETEYQSGPDHLKELADNLSYALLALLEQLSPVERAVFILREAFEFKHQEIAELIGKKTDYTRQVDKRARERLANRDARFEFNREQHEQLFLQFLTACSLGDLAGLEKVLADDVVAYSDGGGKVRAALRPLEGKERVLRYLNRIIRMAPVEAQMCRVNNQLGVLFTGQDQLKSLITVAVSGNEIAAVYTIRNPDKLK